MDGDDVGNVRRGVAPLMKLPRLRLPLAAPGVVVLKYVQATVAVVGMLVLLTSVWLWKTAREIEDHSAELETAIVQTHSAYRTFRRQSEREGFDLSAARLHALHQEVAFANQVLRHQRFSWTQLLNDLEQTTPRHVSMESIVLNKESLELSGAALTLEDLTAFVDQLKIHPSFHRVEISSHKSQRRSVRNRTGPATFLTFDLAVAYAPTL